MTIFIMAENFRCNVKGTKEFKLIIGNHKLNAEAELEMKVDDESCNFKINEIKIGNRTLDISDLNDFFVHHLKQISFASKNYKNSYMEDAIHVTNEIKETLLKNNKFIKELVFEKVL